MKREYCLQWNNINVADHVSGSFSDPFEQPIKT